MNASSAHQRLLLDVADLDRRILQAEQARTRPVQGDRINELAAVRREQLRVLTELSGARDDVRAELTRVESDVTLVEQRRARDSERLQTSTNPKDAQALERELASLARRQSDLEDVQLEVMSRLEEAEAVVTAAQGEIDSTTAEGSALTAQAKADVAAATELGTQLERDRAAVTAGIPEALLADYERRAQRTAGAALLRGGMCEGCRMMLSGTDMNQVRQAHEDTVLSCPECGCILVRTEESGL